MAGAKETPRNKLIALMYLVFITMLALNVSKEVLVGFGQMFHKISDAKTRVNESNEIYYSKIETNSKDKEGKWVGHDKTAKQIRLKSNGSENYFILGINNRIEQIIANLLENSISFSDENQEIIVEVSKDKEDKPRLVVIDEGTGFNEKDTAKIFNRFYSNRPENFGEHSGLGLNIVKNLVELHNGQIKAENNKQRGAKVEIIFPATQ